MTSDNTFDVIVIGAGSSGENVAGRTAAGGLKTAIVENELVGGECSYWACIPSKALLRPMAVLNAARRVPAAASAVGDVDADVALATRDEVANHWDDTHQVNWVKNANITLLRGTARLDGEKRVVVTHEGTTTTYEVSTAVVVATGSHSTMPPIPGLHDVDPWDSRGATSANEIPGRLAIIGGGVVAVEMSQAYKSLGVQELTVLVRGSRLIEGNEPFASDELLDAFRDQGIDVRFGVEAKRVHRLNDGVAELSLSDGSAIEVDRVIVAAGRRAATEDLGVETVGLSPGKYINVDDQLRSTDVEGGWLYAVGDCNGRVLLTHMGKYQARLAGDAITGKNVEAWADHNAVPSVIFTDPQISSVGRTVAKAKQDGFNIRELKVGLDSTAGATVNGNIKGTAQLVIDEDRKVVIGATFTGPEIGEMLHAATIAIAGEVPLERLWHAVPPYPTVSEVWLRLLEQYGF